MNKKTIQIIKPQYHSDIYTQIKRSADIEQDFNIDSCLTVRNDNKIKYIWVDLMKRWVFIYDTLPESQEQSDKVVFISFETEQELLTYLKALKKDYPLDYSDNYTSYISDRMKELNISIRSKQPSKIKELRKIRGDSEIIIKEGTILYTSWGYDQTNVEMFKIVKIIGKNYFIIQEISQQHSDFYSHGMACNTTAGTQHLNKLPVKAFISNDGYMSVCERGYKRSLWIHEKDKNLYKSWYH
jgi:hypothetical protein